ncbi:transcriptional regulatory protein C25B8.11 [Colletotrichum musicola]|uniref:Transcriptional regulatory protein C25B8.11 n=1 Tax=Colletotrichum musicola TaxID=2175873 RepID=A0A8H6K9Z2_9PEZI|nr:transcriptional regulatory protein C25B8.11 [Colletotrichum musicola]
MSSQPRRYMSKRQRPCDFCRSRKAACRIDLAPPCRLCVLHGRECTFVEVAAPRKRTLPLDNTSTFEEMFTPDPPSHNRQSAAHVPSLSQPNISGEASPGDTAMNFVGDFNFETTQSEFEAMFRSPRPPSTPSAASMRTLAPKPTSTAQEASYPPGANPQMMGLSGDMDPLLLQHYRFDENGMFGFKELAIHSVAQDAPVPCHFLVSQQSLFSRRREEAGLNKLPEAGRREELEQVISVEVGRRLVRLFRQFIQPRWPVFSETEFPNPSSTPAHLLAAVYAISLPFAVHDDRLSVDVAYDKPSYAALSRIIDACLAYEVHSPNLAIAQTLLLLALRPSSDPLVADASCRSDSLGRLVACATTLGLHLDPSTWAMATWQKAQRRRLSFLIYAVDKWLACSLGRPHSIHEDNWLVTSIDRDDMVDSGLKVEDETQLINFSLLTQTLSSVLLKLYSLRPVNTLASNYESTLEVTTELLQDLQSLENFDESSTFNRLWVLYVQLVILRAELRPCLRQNCTQPAYTASNVPHQRQSSRKSMRQCTTALSEVIRDLSPDKDSVFWSPWTQFAFSSVCFTLMTMAVTSPDFDEASSWISDLQSTRRCLRLKVASFPFLRLGLLRIDALFWRGISNVLHLQPHVAEAFKASEST